MRSPTEGPLRWARSAALTLAMLGLSTTAHVAGGGSAPGTTGLVTLTVLCALVSVLLTGRRLGFCSIAAVLAVMQVVLHEGLVLLAAGSCQSPTGWTHEMAHGGGTLAAASLCSAAGHSMAAMSMPSPLGMSPMLLGHVVATVLLVAWLCVGERALWTLARRLRGHVPASPAPIGLSLVRVLVDRPAAVMPRRALTSGIGRRGPPSTRDVVTA